MTNEELILRSVGEIVERLVARFSAQASDHETKMAEHRAAFGARTEADRKIIAGLREELEGVGKGEGIRKSAERLVQERNGLLTQVQDMRAEIERLQWENKTMHKDAEDGYAAAIKVLGDPVALSKERDALRAEVAALQARLRASITRGDFAQMEVAALKSRTPQHPVKVGEWVRRTKKCAHFGHVAKVLAFIEPCSYEVQCIEGRGIWYFHNCEPCDTPEATHDTEAGKAAAESAAQHSAGIDIGTWSRKVTT